MCGHCSTCPKQLLPEVAQRASLLWRRLESPSLEHFSLAAGENGFVLKGSVVLELGGEPASVLYHITTDARWATREVSVTLNRGNEHAGLELYVDSEQRWWQGEHELTDLQGLSDVDLSVTPATNTLPLRRLNLSVGESAEATAAWVKFPGLEFEPLPQRYTRLSEHHYRYESASAFADFSADLTLDSEGIVTDYRHSGDAGWIRASQAHKR